MESHQHIRPRAASLTAIGLRAAAVSDAGTVAGIDRPVLRHRRHRPYKPLRTRPVAKVPPVPGIDTPSSRDTLSTRDTVIETGQPEAVPTPEVDAPATTDPSTRSSAGRMTLVAVAAVLLMAGAADLSVDAVRALVPAASTPTLAESQAQQALAALQARHDGLTTELDTATTLSRTLRTERDALLVRNDRLEGEVDALVLETTELNRELLELDLALVAARQSLDAGVETRTVYNFVNVPIGSPIPSGGSDAPAQYDLPLPVARSGDAPGPTAPDFSRGSASDPGPDPDAAEETQGDLINDFYNDLEDGVPYEQLLATLERFDASGQLAADDLRMLYQELRYLPGDGVPLR